MEVLNEILTIVAQSLSILKGCNDASSASTESKEPVIPVPMDTGTENVEQPVVKSPVVEAIGHLENVLDKISSAVGGK